jgi:hypothetical protein
MCCKCLNIQQPAPTGKKVTADKIITGRYFYYTYPYFICFKFYYSFKTACKVIFYSICLSIFLITTINILQTIQYLFSLPVNSFLVRWGHAAGGVMPAYVLAHLYVLVHYKT